MANTGRHPFGSSVRRTFGSPFSGYRGDYTIYLDEPWKLSLRKYPYPIPESPHKRRSRSVSPRKRSANAQDAAKRLVLQDIMSKLDTTQEDLHALARKVALWSREAASLSEGLKEEALLLALSRQADLLAAAEAQNRAQHKQERVYRLSMENSELRHEIGQLVRICKLLLDRHTTEDDPWKVSELNNGRQQSSRKPLREAWTTDEGFSSEPRYGRHVHTDKSDDTRSPAARATPLPPVKRSDAGGRRGSQRQLLYESSDDAGIIAGIEGLSEENVAYVVAADRAQAEADADTNRVVSRSGRGSRAGSLGGAQPGYPEYSAARAHRGRCYETQIAAEAAMLKQELDHERWQLRNQIDNAMDEVGDALKELTFSVQRRNGSGSGAVAGTPPPKAESLVSIPAFGGFMQREEESEPTPSLPEAWRRQHGQKRQEEERQAEVKRVEQELAMAEMELAEAVAEEAAAAAAAEAAEASAKAKEAKIAAQSAAEAAAAAVAAAAEVAEADVGNREEKPMVGTPLKLGEGMRASAPRTPTYQGVPYGVASGSHATILRDVRHIHRLKGETFSYGRSASGGGAVASPAPLDSVLQTEVQKLKMINKTLANTLQSYNRVADRLSDTVAGGVTSRALFTSRGRSGDVNLAQDDFHPPSSVAATCGTSSASSVPATTSFTYTPLYPLGVSTRAVAAPLTPPPALRLLPPEEPHVSWAPSLAHRSRPYSSGASAAVVGEVRRMDAALDDQLCSIRQQLQALRNDMFTERLAALAASAPGGPTATSSLSSLLPVAVQMKVGTDGAAATPYRETSKLARLHEEVSELRRQVRDDRRWFQSSLNSVVAERSAMLRDLHRRIDRLMASAI